MKGPAAKVSFLMPRTDAGGSRNDEAASPCLERHPWGTDVLKKPSSRIVSADIYRAIAVLMMVQGHSLHVLLDPVYKENPLFQVWLFVRGLTAPAFLFLSGFSFAYVTVQRWEKSRVAGRPALRRVLRYLGFILFGYMLHFPAKKIKWLFYVSQDQWTSFLIVDVLQNIGFTLLALQVLVMLVRRPAVFGWTAAIAGTAAFLVTPLIHSVDWKVVICEPLAAFLYSGTGSYFPLFGWSGFILFGASVGTYFSLRLKERTAGATTARLAFLAAGVLAVSLLVFLVLRSVYPPGLDIQSKAEFFFLRLGLVLAIFTAFFWLSRNIVRLPGPVQALSEEAFLIYAVHLCVVYGSIWNDGMRQWYGAQFQPPATLAWVAVFLAGSTATAYGWNLFKKKSRRGAAVVRLGTVSILLLVLL